MPKGNSEKSQLLGNHRQRMAQFILRQPCFLPNTVYFHFCAMFRMNSNQTLNQSGKYLFRVFKNVEFFFFSENQEVDRFTFLPFFCSLSIKIYPPKHACDSQQQTVVQVSMKLKFLNMWVTNPDGSDSLFTEVS